MTAHRKRRIAADEAHSWARNLRLKNPYAKLVLGMLTLYVDGAGCCFVGIEALAEDTELSTDTVRKRLAWLEGVGAIARFPQWLDANGRRNGEGRGKRTTDEIRLLMDADPDVIEARAAGDEVAENEPGDAEISPSPQQGLNPPKDSAGPALALCQPSDSGKGLISEPEPEDKKDSPPTPQAGGDGSQVDQSSEPASEAKPWSGSETWPSFEAAYSEPILRQSIARQVWSALTEAERNLATKAARGYVAWRKAQKKPPNVLNAHTFLREGDAWAEFAKLAPPEPQAKIFIPETSADFAALRVLALIQDRAMPEARFDVTRGAKGIWRYGLVPVDLAGLATFVEKPIEQWSTVEEASRPYGAWSDRIERWTGHRPEAQRIYTGETSTKEWNGKTLTFKKFVLGLRVPCLFPPRKDGTISPELTEHEAQEFEDTG